MRLARLSAALLVLLSLGFAGCGHTDPLDESVDAGSADRYQRWLGRASDDLTPAEFAQLDQAEKDLKLAAMGRGISGDEALMQDFCARADGKTVRQVIVLGLRDRLERLQEDLTNSQDLLAHNSRLRGANEESAAELQSTVDEDRTRLSRDKAAVQETEDEINRINAPAK